jgi:hypothetical protein
MNAARNFSKPILLNWIRSIGLHLRLPQRYINFNQLFCRVSDFDGPSVLKSNQDVLKSRKVYKFEIVAPVGWIALAP